MKKLIDVKKTIEKQEGQTPKSLKVEKKSKKKSKKQQIKELLEEGYHLSKHQILKETGCWNSGARISELRQDGMNIEKRMETHAITGDEFAVYYLVK